MIKKTQRKNYYLLLIIFGVIIWSFSNILPRFMEDPEKYRWHFLFYRGVGMAGTLIIFQALLFKINIINKIKSISISEWIGGISLGLGMVCYVFGITSTTVATFMFMYALSPLVTAIISRVLLKEKIQLSTLLAIICAFSGCIFIITESSRVGSGIGVFFSFLSMLGFCFCTVCIRWKDAGAKAQHPIIAGYVVILLSFLLMTLSSINLFKLPNINIILSLAHGGMTGIGFLMFSIGARHFLSAELVLFAQLEVVISILLSIIPLIGINETLSSTSLIGGMLILFAVIFRSLIALSQKNKIKVAI